VNDVTLDAIIQLVADVLEIPADMLGPDTQGADLAAWDSFGQVRIVLAAEAQFGVSLTMAEIETAGSIGGLLAAVRTAAGRADRQ
jgi:acyl carrier protein